MPIDAEIPDPDPNEGSHMIRPPGSGPGGRNWGKKVSEAESQKLIQEFLKGHVCTEDEIRSKSPIEITNQVLVPTASFLRALYKPNEQINIVWQYKIDENGKPAPDGYGETMQRCEWLGIRIRRTERIPEGGAGAWIRMNPLDGLGISDRNVRAFRFTLVEFDQLPLDTQLAFFSRICLPIAALVTSGGRSIHAWVKVDAPNLEVYQERVGKIYGLLAKLGIDPTNKNPSRLARLPGAQRKIGPTTGDGRQRLLYLNPNPSKYGIQGQGPTP